MFSGYGRVIAAIAVTGALFWSYNWIYDRGYTKGQVYGYDKAQEHIKPTLDAKDQTIRMLTNAESERNKRLNARVDELVLRSQEDAKTIRELRELKQQVRTQIVTEYLSANPQSTQQCALSLPSVQTANRILEAKQ